MANKETLDELIKSLYNHHVNSSRWDEIHDKIYNLIKDKPGYANSVICIPSQVVSCSPNDLIHNMTTSVLMDVFCYDKLPFTHDRRFRCVERAEVEYDPSYRQLVVAGVITDGKKILMLKSNKAGRIKDKITMIQGHVDLNQDAYFKPKKDFLADSFIRELTEEIKFPNDGCENLYLSAHPVDYYYGYEDATEIEHLGIFYIAWHENIDELITAVKSGEPEKHEIIALDVSDYADYAERLDSWSKRWLNEMINRGGFDHMKDSVLVNTITL